MSADGEALSLAGHRRRLRARRVYETVRSRVLPVALVALAGLAIGFTLAGGAL